MPKLAVLLSERNARGLHQVLPEVECVLLERTLYDPPRAAAASKWAAQLRRSFPNAELVPYVWHLISHDKEDGLREHTSRTLGGDPHALGGLKDTPEARQAWTAALPCYRELGAGRLALRTPASISPGAVGRRRIQAFVAARSSDNFSMLWEPEGLWEQAEAGLFADQIGMTLIWRAFIAGRPSRDGATLADPGVWLRVEGTARSPRISPDQLDAMLEHAEHDPDATFLFGGPRALGNLRAFSAEA